MVTSVLAKNTIWVAIGQAARVALQAAYFILIARALGSREYGAYIGVVALVAIAAPFASLGTGNLLIKHVVGEPATFARHWGKALGVTALSGTLLLGFVIIVARVWLPSAIPTLLVITVGLADLLFVRLVDVSAQAYQAHQRLGRTALMQLLVSPPRLVAAVVLVALVPAPNALQWGAAYAISSLAGALVAVTLVNVELGKPVVHLPEFSMELREGFLFSVCVSAQSALLDIDKAMLARLSTLEATGVYGAADRLVGMAFLPVASLQVASYARFFQHGAHGLATGVQLARRLMPWTVCYGVAAAAGLYLSAPLWPALLGTEYGEVVAAIRWLALVPLLKGFHYFGADALTGAGHQGTRTLIHVSIALTNVALNMWLIPLYSWRGAAMASVTAEALMGVAIWSAVWYLTSHPPPISLAERPQSMAPRS